MLRLTLLAIRNSHVLIMLANSLMGMWDIRYFLFGRDRVSLVDLIVIAEWIFLFIKMQMLLVLSEVLDLQVPQLLIQLVFFPGRVDLKKFVVIGLHGSTTTLFISNYEQT